jgi:hypothetical protein
MSCQVERIEEEQEKKPSIEDGSTGRIAIAQKPVFQANFQIRLG